MAHELEWCVLLEDDDGVHTLERSEHIRALRLRAHGTLGSLETAHGIVAVETDDQGVTPFTRATQDIDVPRMEQVEHAVREDDPTRSCLAPAPCGGPRQDLLCRVEGAQKLPWTRGERSISRLMKGRSTSS